jgi:IS30 family transposase
MHRSHTILGREIRRNGTDRKKYRADTAQTFHEKRKHKQHKGKLDKDTALREYVVTKLKEDLSPEQIAGMVKKEKKLQCISHESIYYYIYEKALPHEKLFIHLRTNRLKRKTRGKRKSKKIRIPERISIHYRPQEVQTKERYGDWETDTVEFKRGRQNPYLSVQYERKSQLVRIHKMKNKTAEETTNALVRTIESFPRDFVKTITFDNGMENTEHTILRDEYNIETYFCDPFSSWQKGGVENMNKLIRQYLPRDKNMHEVTDRDIYEIQERLNNRPRKSLNYQTPNEVINKVVL